MRIVGLLLLAGCGEVVQRPPPDAPLSQLEQLEVAAPPNADAAIAVVMQSYEMGTGATTSVRVRWYGQQIEINGALATGLTYSCSNIWVWTEPGRLNGETALAHELGHCMHSVVVVGDLDSAHADPAWWGQGGYVQMAQQVLVASGL